MTADSAARSRAAFAERFPAVMSALAETEPQCTLIAEGGVPTDIAIGDRHIYGADARRTSAEQVRAFMQKPLRLIMEVPEAAGLVSPICIGLKQALERTITDAGMGEISREPQGAPTFLVVFGVGLGYHIEELIRSTGARWVIIVEPFIEFFAHSFATVDWAADAGRVDDAGGEIHLVTELDPGRIIQSIMKCMSRHGLPISTAAGSSCTTRCGHLTRPQAAARRRRVRLCQSRLLRRRDQDDDECGDQLWHPSFWLLDAKPRLHRPETVAVVGAGPSLDEAIETLHRIRDRVVLFSAGTALRPLLRQGLVPDFHCELENGPQVRRSSRSRGAMATCRKSP